MMAISLTLCRLVYIFCRVRLRRGRLIDYISMMLCRILVDKNSTRHVEFGSVKILSQIHFIRQ